MTEILAEHRLFVKRHAAKPFLGHGVRVDKPKRTKPPQTETQAIVMRRIKLELDAQRINPTSLAARARKTGLQRTVADILAGLSDPRVNTLHKVADALGVAPWRLFMPIDRADSEETHKVVELPQPPSIMGPSGRESRISKGRRKLKG